jgi:DNA-binding MarR family transcriptional regulator
VDRQAVPPSLEEIADRLHSGAIHLLRFVRRVDEASGLSPARLSALSVLVFDGPRTLGELAAAERVTPPTMTRLIAALEAEGLVRRDPHPTDRRAVRVRATRTGTALLQRARARRVHQLVGRLRALDDQEVETLSVAGGLLGRLSGIE